MMKSIEKHKFCWMAKQYRDGWGLGIAIGNRKTLWLQGLRLNDATQVKKALKSGVVFVEMANNGRPNDH